MKTYQIVLFLVLLPVIGLQADTGDSSRILISKIKFIIDDEIFIWKENAPVPENPTENSSQPIFLSTFFSYKPGDSALVQEVEKEVLKAAHRLEKSGLFYNPSVSIVPPRLHPDRRTIIIQVTDGFRMRFGGGEAFGQLGIKNLGGKGHSITFTAGANINEIKYRNDTSLPGNFYWGLDMGYNNSLFDEYYESISHSGSAGSYIGYRINPDLHISLGLSVNYFGPGDRGDDQLILFSIYQSTKYASFFRINEYLYIQYGTSCNFELTPGVDDTYFSFEAIGFVKPKFGEIFGLGLTASAGWREQDESGRIYNMYNDPVRSVKSGYPLEELYSSEFLLLNSEAGFYFPRAVIPPIFNIDTSLYAFYDLGSVKGELKDAVGLGTRINFDNPVFTGFNFTYGWNRKGQGRFLFTVTIEL